MFRMFSPYILARINAAATVCDVIGIEGSQRSTTYAWEPRSGGESFNRVTLFKDMAIENATPRDIAGAVRAVLDAEMPDVICAGGWYFPEALAMLEWALENGRPAIVMSESTEIDHRRRWWKEAVKGSIVGNFNAALVGGGAHSRYLGKLGFPPDRIFPGYDAVDNAYFTAAADGARREADAVRARRGLPKAYFLASGRFIAIKNFERLIEAYAAYRAGAGEYAWDLVILGDGELRPALEATVRRLGLIEAVHLPGFKQYEDLPDYYALAGAFVHVSTVEPWGLVVNEAMASGLPVIVSDRCGCAEDLVRDGENGWRVPAPDTGAIAARLADMAAADHQAMGHASRAIIERFSPAAFASGLARALEVALDKPAPARQAYHRQILKLARGL